MMFINQVVTVAALSCIGEYSHANNYSKRILGLYFYATGAQRQAITVLSTIGLSESYTNLISKNQSALARKKRPETWNCTSKATQISHCLLILFKKLLLVQELFTNYPSLCELKHGRSLPLASTLLFMTILTFNYGLLSKLLVAMDCIIYFSPLSF